MKPGLPPARPRDPPRLPPEQDRPTPLDRRSSLPDGIPAQIGAYRVVRLLGQGGWGVVLEARRRLLGQRVAVKVLRPALGQDSHFVERFQREIAAIGRLGDHPNLVRARHAGEEDGALYLAMDYLDTSVGHDLPLNQLVALWKYGDSQAALTDEINVGASATFTVPTTIRPAYLCLGCHDGFEWSKNSGDVAVTITWNL